MGNFSFCTESNLSAVHLATENCQKAAGEGTRARVFLPTLTAMYYALTQVGSRENTKNTA